MKLFVLFTGEYEGRGIHSVHTLKDDAIAIDAIVRKNWHDSSSQADIEEWELDEPLCAVCGYDKVLHVTHPDTFKHEFSARVSDNQNTKGTE